MKNYEKGMKDYEGKDLWAKLSDTTLHFCL